MTRQKLSITLWATLLGSHCLAQRAAAQRNPVLSRAESKAYVKHTKNGDVFVTEDASFDFVRLLDDAGEKSSFLRVLHTDHNEWSEGREGIQGTVTVSAQPALRTGGGKLLWTFHTRGNLGQPLPDFRMFRVSNWPCCSEPFKNVYFSLLDGSELYTTNGVLQNGDDPGLLRIAGEYDGRGYTKFRYIGFGSATTSGEDVPTLQYGTDRAVKQRFSLIGREYGDNFDVPSISFVEHDKGPANYLEISGRISCTLLLSFPDGPMVSIPIEDDVVRADKATLPHGYSLRVENVR
jgi:hypothetical protein